MPMTLNLDFFSCLVGSSDRLSSFSGEGSLDSCREGGRDGGRDGGREGGLDGVLEGGSEPFEGPLTEEFLELCLDFGGLMMLLADSRTDGGQEEAGGVCLVLPAGFKMLLKLSFLSDVGDSCWLFAPDSGICGSPEEIDSWVVMVSCSLSSAKLAALDTVNWTRSFSCSVSFTSSRLSLLTLFSSSTQVPESPVSHRSSLSGFASSTAVSSVIFSGSGGAVMRFVLVEPPDLSDSNS